MKNTAIGVFVDDGVEKAMYERVFARFEHRVDGFVFSNPEQGFEAARNTQFNVVFIDIHYWGENFGGISILEQFKKVSGNQVIAIALTPLLQEGDLERIIAGGFSMCIEKPMSLEVMQLFCGRASHVS